MLGMLGRPEGGLGVTPLDGLSDLPRLGLREKAADRKRGGAVGALVTMGETLRLAIDSLRAHKLRSFLTLLGVILAVTTLVVVMSAIAGLNMYVANRVANLGANVFLVHRCGIITSEDA